MEPTFRHRRPENNMPPVAKNCNRLFPFFQYAFSGEKNFGEYARIAGEISGN
jgi:hypothetical protein